MKHKDYSHSPPDEEFGEEGAQEGAMGEGAEEGSAEGGEEQVAEALLPSITLPVIVSLGRSYMSVKEILKLRPGQILELNKNPKEPVDLLVNGKVVARAELVDVDGKLAIRILKIIE
jgi:flagellar motor switch protein FliN/FliY